MKLFRMMTAMLLLTGFAAVTIAKDKKYTIAVIPKGTTHIFWKAVHAGAEKAGREFGGKVIWQGPLREDDRNNQIQVVQNFISRRADAIVLAPLDSRALVRPVRNAVRRKIKVVIIDSALKWEGYVSFVATDNFKGGELCAKRLAKVMGGKGSALMMRYMEGSASTMQREKGFLAGMKKYGPGIKLVSTDQYGGATAGLAFKRAQSLLNKYGGIDGVYCPNESTTFGMLRALQTAGKAGKVKFVGFDSSDALIKALKKGEINGLALQDPFKMGYMGVKTAIEALQGKKVKKRIDTGVVLVTPENIDKPKIKLLLSPPRAK